MQGAWVTPHVDQMTLERVDAAKAEAKEFTQRIYNAIVGRFVDNEKRISDLVTLVTSLQGTPKNFPKTREYTVKSGDSLTLIAKRELGQAGRFTEIAILNYDRYPSLKTNANLIQVGWRLRLPA